MQRSIPTLWALVIILLILNLLLLYALNLARLTAVETLGEVEATLDSLANEVIVYNVELNQAVPIRADVPFNQTMEIPLNTVVPIDQVLTVPFQMGGSEVELDVPLKADFPIDMVVPVEFNEVVNVDTTIQLNTTVPVEIDIAQTPLVGYLKQARLDIAQLRNYLALQGKATAMEEIIIVATPKNAPTSANDSQSQLVTVEAVDTDRADISPPISADSVSQPDNAAIQPELGWCMHTYWPLQPGTTWTYNSSNTSYSQRVDNALNNQVHLSTQYEGQDIQFSLGCYQEGLGGNYLGDMRRLTELGNLIFSNPRGMFLSRPEVMEDIGRPWTQEYDVSGTVEGRQGDKPVVGHISRGQAVAVYTSTGFETLETPLGPREALRIEQKIDLELDIDFDLGNQTIPATEVVNLTTVYWFVKGVGPVKMHWQGGAIQRDFKVGDTAVNQPSSVPALAEEHLVFVCVLSAEEFFECMRIAGISQSDLTVPPETELDIPGFVFSDDVGKDDSASTTEIVDTNELVESPVIINELPETSPDVDDNDGQSEVDDNDRQSALLAYAKAVIKLGEKINEAGEKFGEAAIAYRNGEITLDEFRNKFLSFAPKVKELIQEIDRLSPPPEAETIHKKLTGGLDNCNEAVGLMDDWFDTGDSDTKEVAAILVASCINQVTEAGDELEELLDEN